MVALNSPEAMSKLLDQVVVLCVEAGQAIMAIYDGPSLKFTYKEDQSPLTEADLASHHVITDGLARLTPEWPVLSEESEDTSYETRREWDVLWLVDPLDGTKEFLKRNGEFTVNIALVEKGIPVLGVVYAPAKQKIYFAARGIGAFRLVDGTSERIWVQPRSGDATRVIVSRSHGTEEATLFTSQYGPCKFVPMGSSLKFCLLAEGAADIYPRSGPTMEWDTAAAQCILEQAGGSVISADGTPFTYNKPNLLNPAFVAQGVQ